MRKVALFSVLLMLFGVSAFADISPNYVALKLGGYLPQSDDLEDFDDSIYGELAFGHYFNRNIAAEFGVGYTTTNASLTETDPILGTASLDVDVTIIPITLGVKGFIPLGNFEPFATAGVGLYYSKAEVSASIAGFGASASENDTAFGFYLGAGANFNVAPNILLGLEGKYFWAKPSFEGEDVEIDGITLTANLGFRF